MKTRLKPWRKTKRIILLKIQLLKMEKIYSSENSTPQNGEDIISNEDAEKLEGGIKHEDLERPSEGSLGGIICCNG